MKIIFLDIDGVLNSNPLHRDLQTEISNGSAIDRDKTALLGRIIHETGASIVLHSGWRFWFHEISLEPTAPESRKLVQMLSEFQLKISGLTPDFSTEEIRRTKKFSLVKAKEILSWLENQPEVTQWIVIDDLDLHSETVRKHQVRTNPETGLTQTDAAKAVEMLR